jgi:hypothetical protein
VAVSGECAGEQPSRVTWEIEPQPGGVCKLTVTHDRLGGSPKCGASVVGPGWMYVLSGLGRLVTAMTATAERWAQP